MQKLLILHPGALGDVLLTLPFLYSLKRDNRIALYTQSWLTGLHRVFEFIDEWGSFESNNLHKIFGDGFSPNSLQIFKGCSKIIALFKSEHSSLVKNLQQLPIPFICKSFIPPEDFKDHISFYLKEIFGVDPTPLLKSSITKKEGSVVIHPGSGNKLKNWRIENFINLAKKLNERGEKVLFLLGPAEADLMDIVISAKFKVLLKVELPEVYKVIQGARLYIGNDSGITHLAQVSGTKTIAIFGPTDPKVWRPLGGNVVVIYTEHSCSPCIRRNNMVKCTENACMPDYKVVEQTTLKIIENQ